MPFVDLYLRRRASAVAGAIMLLALLTPCSSAAILTYYSSRSAFNTAEPGLPLEVFQPILAGLIPSPLSSTSNDSDFPAGNILPGITLADTSGSDLYTTGGAIGLYFLEDTLAIGFNPGCSRSAPMFLAAAAARLLPERWRWTFSTEPRI